MAFLQNIGTRFVEKCGVVEPIEPKKSSEPTCLGAAQHSPLFQETKEVDTCRCQRRRSATDLCMAFAHRPTKLEFFFWPSLQSTVHSTLGTIALSFLTWNAWIFYIIIFGYKLIYIFGNKFISVQITQLCYCIAV